MKIKQFKAENVKKLKVIEITPDGNTIIIGGKNEQGKSSVLDSIMATLGGKQKMPDVTIRKGQKKGYCELDIDNFTVKRTFTESGGGTLTVKTKDGASYNSPQKMLDDLIGGLAFDPLKFANDPAARSAMMQQLVGVDLNAMNDKRQRLYDERRDINRDMNQLEGELTGYRDLPDDCPTEEVSVVALSNELEKANDNNSETANIQNDFLASGQKIKQLEESLQLEKNLHAKLQKQLSKRKTIDIAPIKMKMAQAQKNNELYRKAHAQSELIDKIYFMENESKKKTKAMELIDAKKMDAIKKAKLPVDGLSYDEQGITYYNDIPFAQASTSAKLKVSMAVAMAANPKLKVMFIYDGDKLDDDNLKLICTMADKHGHQVWMEKVGTGSEMSVIMEDGTIKKG